MGKKETQKKGEDVACGWHGLTSLCQLLLYPLISQDQSVITVITQHFYQGRYPLLVHTWNDRKKKRKARELNCGENGWGEEEDTVTEQANIQPHLLVYVWRAMLLNEKCSKRTLCFSHLLAILHATDFEFDLSTFLDSLLLAVIQEKR